MSMLINCLIWWYPVCLFFGSVSVLHDSTRVNKAYRTVNLVINCRYKHLPRSGGMGAAANKVLSNMHSLTVSGDDVARGN